MLAESKEIWDCWHATGSCGSIEDCSTKPSCRIYCEDVKIVGMPTGSLYDELDLTQGISTSEKFKGQIVLIIF